VAYESGVPVLFEPVSVVKSRRIAPIAKYVSVKAWSTILLVSTIFEALQLNIIIFCDDSGNLHFPK
jgi:hypothetical protein